MDCQVFYELWVFAPEAELFHKLHEIFFVYSTILTLIAHFYHLMHLLLRHFLFKIHSATHQVLLSYETVVIVVVYSECFRQLHVLIPFLNLLRHQRRKFILVDGARAIFVHFCHHLFYLFSFQKYAQRF